jgi:cobalamin biosynthetic protein CobC
MALPEAGLRLTMPDRPVTDHGGSLDAARRLFPDAPAPWIDLSTGINPHSYPLFDLPQAALARLPEPARIAGLAAVAALAYGAPAGANVVAAPGTQILLPLVMRLVRPGRAVILGPTYVEHARAAALAGHHVDEAIRFGALHDGDLAVVVNPNNPDGRVFTRAQLLDLAETLRRKGGLLVVDEAFMDVGPRGESLAGDAGRGGVVVLKSFGKFFGLAGLRLGFAIASEDIVQRLAGELGPWAVSGAALEYGLRALADRGWQAAMRTRLQEEAARLDALLARHGLPVLGGTPLFRFVGHGDAGAIFGQLGRAGILARRFERMPDRLRLGLPAGEVELARLDRALTAWGQRRNEPA